MPRFFFHIGDGEKVKDLEGKVLANIDAARVEAVRNIRGMLAEDVLHGHLPLHQWIDVADEHGWPVMRVTFGEALAIDE